ncbi:hypothetical protein ACFFJI_12165 [Allobacillus sp. GCM10007491]|uniref:Uncharacterized protein n=1 Tax=Allobacillus saliphilus TaxID=2912308 RepID=A0A941CUK1_9BACI|nr:hypothetical protein [Allobacillus saliphilus]MBR7553469.1 hypothetical protein [Allobacillus saliphilus]
MKKIIFLISIVTLCLIGYFIYVNLGFGNPTAREILDDNPDADIIKLDNLIYVKNKQEDISSKYNIEHGEFIGEIKKRSTNKWWFRNLYASKLPKGTKLYTTDDQYEKGDAPFIILVEYNDEVLVYDALVEG